MIHLKFRTSIEEDAWLILYKIADQLGVLPLGEP